MSHYSTAPRRGYVMVHHAGYPNAHLDNTQVFCNYDGGKSYDFQIRWDGTIVRCAAWDDAVGAHALGCNCQAEGILLMGCFGGCTSGNVAAPSAAQECSLAYVMAHLGTSAQAPQELLVLEPVRQPEPDSNGMPGKKPDQYQHDEPKLECRRRGLPKSNPE